MEKKVQTKDEVLAELMAEHIAPKKKSWGALTKSWVPHDLRDQAVDFVRRWSEKTEISVGRFPPWLGIVASKFYDWRASAAAAPSDFHAHFRSIRFASTEQEFAHPDPTRVEVAHLSLRPAPR